MTDLIAIETDVEDVVRTLGDDLHIAAVAFLSSEPERVP